MEVKNKISCKINRLKDVKPTFSVLFQGYRETYASTNTSAIRNQRENYSAPTFNFVLGNELLFVTALRLFRLKYDSVSSINS